MWRWSLFIFLGLLGSQSGWAATYYVATTGSDSNSCTTAQTCTSSSCTTAKRNAMGASGGAACLSSGDTLYLRAGTYSQAIDTQVTTFPGGSSWSAPTTIAGYPGETVTLNSSGYAIINHVDEAVQYVVYDNFVLDGINQGVGTNSLFNVAGNGNTQSHIRLQNSEVKNAYKCAVTPQAYNGTDLQVVNNNIHDNSLRSIGSSDTCYGIYAHGSNGLIEGNRIHDNGNFAIHVYREGPPAPTAWVIRKNLFYNNGVGSSVDGLGMHAANALVSGPDHVMYNNILYNNNGIGQDYCITMGWGNSSPNIQLYNNTCYGHTVAAIQYCNSCNPNPIVRNNIFWNNGGTTTEINGTQLGTYSNNLCEDSTSGCVLTGQNPQFVSTSTPDFHLQASSPAINAGTTVSAVPTDYDGNTRPQGSAYDIGAYEFVTSTPASLMLRVIK